MTPTQLKEAAQVMMAASEGKQVQYQHRGHYEWTDLHLHEASWNWGDSIYRIKPEPPKLREFYCTIGVDGNPVRILTVPLDAYSNLKTIKVREVI